MIGEAIDSSDAVLVLLSRLGTESRWVRWEIGWALKQGRPIVPVLLESISWKAIFPLTSLHYLDFRDGSLSGREASLRGLNALLDGMGSRGDGRGFTRSVGERRATTADGHSESADLPEEEVHRLVIGSVAARKNAPETAAYLGRLVLQQSPNHLAGWLRQFVETVEAGLRTIRVARLTERLRTAEEDDDIELAEALARDILFLDPSHGEARSALGRAERERQCRGTLRRRTPGAARRSCDRAVPSDRGETGVSTVCGR